MKQYLIISSAIAQEQAPKNTKVLPWTTFGLVGVSLYDYDGIVIDASSIPEPEIMNDSQKGKQRQDFTMFESNILKPEVIQDVLFNSEAFIVILGNPSTKLERCSIADRLGISLIMTPSHGTNLVVNCETQHQFYNYVKQIRDYSYAFKNNPRMRISGYAEPRRLSVESLLCLKVGDSVAARFGGPGFSNLYLLPVLPSGVQCSVGQIFDILVDDDDEVIEPDWTSDIVMAGQEEIESRLNDIEHSISELKEKKATILNEKAIARQPLEMLYKIGKPLENSIKTTLRNIGIVVVEPPTEEGREFTFEFAKQKFVVEVKSTRNQFFDKKGLRQVVEWQNDALMDDGEEYKPVFITSNEVTKPSKDRNNNYLPQNLLKFAQERRIAVISVSVLLEAVNLIRKGELEVGDLIEILAKADGVVKSGDISS